MYSDFRQHVLILILIAITYILHFLICICRKNLLVLLSHAFDVNNEDDSDDESDNECGEDKEITHCVGSKNIGAAHEKNNQDNLEQAYIALWEDKIVQVYIGYYLAGKKDNCYGFRYGGDWTHVG